MANTWRKALKYCGDSTMTARPPARVSRRMTSVSERLLNSDSSLMRMVGRVALFSRAISLSETMAQMKSSCEHAAYVFFYFLTLIGTKGS